MSRSVSEAVSIVLVYPDLLGTYGDSGNATILAQRLRWRGYRATVTTVLSGEAVPASGDLYVVGGGEDLPQTLAASQLNASQALHRAVNDGAVVFAVCAGLQILGTRFVAPEGGESAGLSLLDCTTVRGRGPRAVGELVVDPTSELGGLRQGGSAPLDVLSGYENHGGVTTLGPGSQPLGRVTTGVGNGDGSGTDGVRTGKVLGTYLHGPALARNPDLADLLLSWVVGPLGALDDYESLELRAERLREAPGEAARPASRLSLLRRWR